MRVRLWIVAACALALACKKDRTTLGGDAGIIRQASALVADIQEVEPNDRIEQATPLPLGKPVRGTLLRTGKRPDVDCFRVTNELPSGILRAEVTGVPGIDLSLAVVRVQPRRELARANNEGAGGGEVIPNVGVAPGDYAVVVRHVSGTATDPDASYLLTVSLHPAAEGEEREPNDTRPDAQKIEPGRPLRGLFGRKQDRDWYRLELPDLQGEHTARVEMTGVPGVTWTSLEVLDEIEVSLKKGRSKSMGVLLPNLYVKPGQKTLYLVARGGRQANTRDPYTLSVTLQKMEGPFEREPNDTPPRATPLAAGEKMKGFVAPAGDVDWYALEVSTPSIARLSVTGVENVDLTLAVHDAAGALLLSVDEGRVREGEILPGVPLRPGRTLVRVAAKRAHEENVFAPYELVAELRPDTGKEEHEPNPDARRANPIAVGATREGFLHPKRDVDVYRLDLAAETAPRPLRVELRGVPKVRPRLRLRDGGGALLAETPPQAPEETLRLDRTLAPGVYFIEIHGDDASNPRDRYELSVREPR
jgi:uncharacterized protein YjhX (UPF0386 family)